MKMGHLAWKAMARPLSFTFSWIPVLNVPGRPSAQAYTDDSVTHSKMFRFWPFCDFRRGAIHSF